MCGIQMIGAGLNVYSVLHCGCGEIIYQYLSTSYPTTEEIDVTLEELRAKPGVPAEIKLLKTKETLKSKALVQYKRLLKKKKDELAEVINPHIDSIKAAKNNTIAQIKISEEYKTYQKADSSSNNLSRKFQNKYSLSRYHMRKLLGRANYGRSWMTRPVYMIQRKFRIRL
jgi:hypothetical protein